jgi:hypothetical protein
MALNTLEIGFFEDLVRSEAKALKPPEQIATELKNHIQKEIDAQFLQNPFTVDDLPIDSFQPQNTTETDDNDQKKSNTKPSKQSSKSPIVLPKKIKQWLG